MKITFYGAAQTVTGSMHLVEANGRRILLDCGLYQGHRKEAFEINRNIPFDASKMLSGNFTAFLSHFYDKEAKEFKVNLEDEIMRGCLLTQGGKIIHERFKED